MCFHSLWSCECVPCNNINDTLLFLLVEGLSGKKGTPHPHLCVATCLLYILFIHMWFSCLHLPPTEVLVSWNRLEGINSHLEFSLDCISLPAILTVKHTWILSTPIFTQTGKFCTSNSVIFSVTLTYILHNYLQIFTARRQSHDFRVHNYVLHPLETLDPFFVMAWACKATHKNKQEKENTYLVKYITEQHCTSWAWRVLLWFLYV